MSGQQQVVAAGGAALVTLAFWTGPARKTIKGGLFSSGASDADEKAAHAELVKIGGAILFVGAATLLSGISTSWGTAMVTVIIGLLVLWSMNHFNGTTQGG